MLPAGPQVEAAWPTTTAAEKMIKRRFYKVEHPDNDGSSSSSSSESDDEGEEREEEETQGEEEDEEKEVPADEWRKRFSLSDGSSGQFSTDYLVVVSSPLIFVCCS